MDTIFHLARLLISISFEFHFTLTVPENTQCRLERAAGRKNGEQSNQGGNKKKQNDARTQFVVIFLPLARYLRLLF